MEIACVGLPSGGKVYENVNLENVKVRTLKGKDEKILAEMNIDNVEKKYTELLSNLVSGINVNNLTLGDRTWLLLWERINSYSPNFPVSIVCDTCFQKIELKIDLSQLDVVELPEDFKEPFTITLENGETLDLRLFRVSDEIKMLDWEKKLGASNSYMYRWALSLADDRDIPTKISYLESLDAKDLLKIKKFHKDFEHGPNLGKCAYKCPKCGGEGYLALPFRPDFLVPSSEDIS
jgi:hypothetical protein